MNKGIKAKIVCYLFIVLFLTWQGVLKGVEDSHGDIDEDRAHEDDVAPEGHVTRDPEQGRIAPQLFLPFHLSKHVLVTMKEISNF